MSGAIESSNEVEPCDCEESKQLQHENNLLQEQLQYLKDMTENELMALKQNEALRQKIDQLEVDNKKLRLDVESSSPKIAMVTERLEKELKAKQEMFDAEVQTEEFGSLEDGRTVCTNIESPTLHYTREQAAMKEELELAIQDFAMVIERLEKELEAKQALQAEYDRLKADQEKLLLQELRNRQEIEELEDLYRKATEQNEKLRDEIENLKLFTFGSRGVLDQTFRSLGESLEEAIANQNEVDQMIADFDEPKTFGGFKPLLVAFLVSIIIAFFASLDFISGDSTGPNALYDRYHYT